MRGLYTVSPEKRLIGADQDGNDEATTPHQKSNQTVVVPFI